jgi:hypothetical protein
LFFLAHRERSFGEVGSRVPYSLRPSTTGYLYE